MKRKIALIMAAALLCACIAACSSESKESSSASVKNDSTVQTSDTVTGVSSDGASLISDPVSSKAGTGSSAAEEAAELYLLSAPYSYQGLVQELQNEGFTKEQAVAAADSCCADWNEQATRAAKNYLKLREFTQEGLEEQLKYDGFTEEQAKHGASEAMKQATETTAATGSDKESFIEAFE